MQRIIAIVLAAGGSTRFGTPKQLHSHEGEPLVRRAVHAALGAGVEEVIVVIGSDARDVASALDGNPSVRTILNQDWNTGLASSLKVGLAAIGDSDGVLITLADQPLVDSTAIQRLIDRFDESHRIIASGYDNTTGVPAIFGNEHIDELKTLTGDYGAGKWIRSRIADVTIVPLEEAAIDIDTPADAARLEEL